MGATCPLEACPASEARGAARVDAVVLARNGAFLITPRRHSPVAPACCRTTCSSHSNRRSRSTSPSGQVLRSTQPR